MRTLLATLAALVVLVPVAEATHIKNPHRCKSSNIYNGYGLRVSEAGCVTARQIQNAYWDKASGSRVTYVRAGGRTWRCSYRILENHGYDPAIYGDRVTGRILCVHVGNRGRWARWFYDGGGD